MALPPALATSIAAAAAAARTAPGDPAWYFAPDAAVPGKVVFVAPPPGGDPTAWAFVAAARKTYGDAVHRTAGGGDGGDGDDEPAGTAPIKPATAVGRGGRRPGATGVPPWGGFGGAIDPPFPAEDRRHRWKGWRRPPAQRQRPPSKPRRARHGGWGAAGASGASGDIPRERPATPPRPGGGSNCSGEVAADDGPSRRPSRWSRCRRELVALAVAPGGVAKGLWNRHRGGGAGVPPTPAPGLARIETFTGPRTGAAGQNE
ncbi:hypothetical protein MMPV_009869 [Pyropia vietnamensis]